MNPVAKPVASVSLQTGHLAKCPRCGELNGRSAEACWKCEADLRSVGLASLIAARAPAAVSAPAPAPAPAPVATPTRPVASTPAASRAPLDLNLNLNLNLPVLDDVAPAPAGAYAPGGMWRSLPPDLRRAAPWVLFGLFSTVVLALGVGAYVYLDDDAVAPHRPGPSLATPRAFPPTGPRGELSPIDAALRQADELLAQPAPEVPPEATAPAAAPPEPARGRKPPSRNPNRNGER